MNERQKMMLFINEPVFLANHLQRKDEKQFFSQRSLKSIYVSTTNVERFRNLEEARNRVSQNKAIDNKIVSLIELLHANVRECHLKNQEIEGRKAEILEKFEINFLKDQLEGRIQKLEEVLGRYNSIQGTLAKHREEITKIIKMTEIKKALDKQNKILMEENAQLRAQEMGLARTA